MYEKKWAVNDTLEKPLSQHFPPKHPKRHSQYMTAASEQ